MKHLGALKCVACLSLALVCLGALATSKPTSREQAELDPMMALPSRNQPQHLEHQEVQYVSLQPQQPSEELQTAVSVAGTQEEVVEYHLQPQPESNGANYPGEIVYVNQNDAEPQSEHQQQDELAQNPMAATILTEVPIKDMPPEVLAKLKSEYGVKVVATRERPGANLVINCEDNSAGFDSSICAKQQRPQHGPIYTLQPQEEQPETIAYEIQRQPLGGAEYESQPRAAARSNSQQSLYQISHESEPAAPGEPQQVYVTHRSAEAHETPAYRGAPQEYQQEPPSSPIGHEQQEAGRHTNGEAEEQRERQVQPENEYYSTRAANSAPEQPTTDTESESAAQLTPGEQSNGDQHQEHQHEAHSTESTAPATHETSDQNAGFDDQPKGESSS